MRHMYTFFLYTSYKLTHGTNVQYKHIFFKSTFLEKNTRICFNKNSMLYPFYYLLFILNTNPLKLCPPVFTSSTNIQPTSYPTQVVFDKRKIHSA